MLPNFRRSKSTMIHQGTAEHENATRLDVNSVLIRRKSVFAGSCGANSGKQGRRQMAQQISLAKETPKNSLNIKESFPQ